LNPPEDLYFAVPKKDYPVSDIESGFAKNEPVVVGHFVLWLLVNAGAFVVGHTHLVTQAQWDSLATGLVPTITAVILGAIALVMRRYVTPAWKKVSDVLDLNSQPVSVDPPGNDPVAGA
jgi:lysylphosphatidylglycerol synthetase-like protein (DUF2156 family)